MRKRKNCVAMLLAGGQGSRLYALTTENAKPAVTYGAKYKIIDFPLSNCINSNIDTIGVLTQYQPLRLNDYIGNGQPWDLDRNFGGVHILPPYQGKNKSDWYKGTANAIYQNLNFIKRYNPEYVLILSGDHIYKMNYNEMIKIHEATKADCTIAVLNVDIKEASRFGIMNATKDGKIYEFEEKPKNPKSTLASMGIYLFKADILYKYLEEDELDSNSSNDFGKNIIPKMLNDGKHLQTYEFNGYWKDVGTISSLWEANMDLLGDHPKFDIFDPTWKIYSRSEAYPPQLIGINSDIQSSLITEGCLIDGIVINSIISNNVKVAPGAKIIDSVIFENSIIGENAVVEYSIIDENVIISEGVKIGDKSAITVVGKGNIVKKDIAAGAMLEKEQ